MDGSVESSDSSVKQEILDAYIAVCQLSYWQRLWVVQELILASTATLQYGSTQIDWEYFGGGLAKFCSMNRKYDMEREVDEAVLTALGNRMVVEPLFNGHPLGSGLGRSIAWRMRDKREVFQIYGHWKIRRSRGERYLPALDDLLLSFEDSKCRYWQDKLYGLLGLVEDGDKFPVDYNESGESLKQRVLAEFAKPEDELEAFYISMSEERARLSPEKEMRRRLNLALDRIISRSATPDGDGVNSISNAFQKLDFSLSSRRLRELDFRNLVLKHR